MSPVATPVDEVKGVSTLCAADRCDRCGAQAYVRVQVGGGTLDFCKHDYDKQEAKLAEGGAVVLIDERRLLTQQPGASV